MYQDGARVGRRIRQARRELGLTQAELANRIGVSLGALDRFETGKSDPSGKLEQIAEITGRPVSWYTSTDQGDPGGETYETGLPAELRRRLSESSGRQLPTDAEPVETGHAADVAEPRSRHPTEDSSARGEDGQPVQAEPSEELLDEHDVLAGQHEPRAALAVVQEDPAALDEPGAQPAPEDSSARADTQPVLAVTSEDLLDERRAYEQRQQELEAALAVEQQQRATRAAQMAEELERVNANQQELAGMLEQSRSELATSRAQEAHLSQRTSELEIELQASEKRADDATARLDQAWAELGRLQDDERVRAEGLDRRDAELAARSAELDTREAAVGDAKKDVGFRSTQLDTREAELRFRSAQLDTREAEQGFRSTQLDTREAEQGLRSAQLDTREAELGVRSAQLDTREAAVGAIEPPAEAGGRPLREDEHLAVAPDHGYRLVAREGAPPAPGAIVELGDVRYRCLRVQASPFFGDNRQCAVLELLPPEPSRSTDPLVE